MNVTVVSEAIKKIALVLASSMMVYVSPVLSNEAEKMTSDKILVPIHRAKGQGKDYAWGKDHIFVKLSKAETGGALTLIQDNLKKGFNLGLHLHHKHTEIFYILDGEVDFVVAAQEIKATKGTVLYIPEGTPHAASSSTGSQMLMFYSPGGFDEMLSEIDSASFFQRYSPFASAKRDKKYDMNKLSGDETSSSKDSRMLFVKAGEGRQLEEATGTSVLKLHSSETNGLATLFEQNLEVGSQRYIQAEKKSQLEILYVLEGEIDFIVDNQTQSARVGSTLFFPAGTSAIVKSASGAKLLVYKTPAD